MDHILQAMDRAYTAKNWPAVRCLLKSYPGFFKGLLK